MSPNGQEAGVPDPGEKFDAGRFIHLFISIIGVFMFFKAVGRTTPAGAGKVRKVLLLFRGLALAQMLL